ncbi:MAG: hypothetical protein AAF487_00740 [Bacteroidota bacterium]
MYKDIITYELAEGIDEDHVKKVGTRILEEWMQKLPGFISWELNRSSEGKYVDIVTWESKEAALNAQKEMTNIPNMGEWYSCYDKESISSINIELITLFKID